MSEKEIFNEAYSNPRLRRVMDMTARSWKGRLAPEDLKQAAALGLWKAVRNKNITEKSIVLNVRWACGDRLREIRRGISRLVKYMPSVDVAAPPEKEKDFLFEQMDFLAEADRFLLRKTFFEGLKPSQLAAELGVSCRVVVYRLRKAIRNLKWRLHHQFS